MHHQHTRPKGLVMHTAGGNETFNVFIYGNEGIPVDECIKSFFYCWVSEGEGSCRWRDLQMQ